MTDQDINPTLSPAWAPIHSLIYLAYVSFTMYPITDQDRNPSPSPDSGYDEINEPYRPDDQLATTSTPDQLIQLLESNVRISLSNDEAED
jgi:hypothetical protein